MYIFHIQQASNKSLNKTLTLSLPTQGSLKDILLRARLPPLIPPSDLVVMTTSSTSFHHDQIKHFFIKHSFARNPSSQTLYRIDQWINRSDINCTYLLFRTACNQQYVGKPGTASLHDSGNTATTQCMDTHTGSHTLENACPAPQVAGC